MEMMDDLSPSEQEIAGELSTLAADPSRASWDSIMHGIRAARRTAAPRARWHLSWHLVMAVAAAALLLGGSTVGAMAASSQALPHSPAYPLRFAGEGIRLAVASPADKEHLRIDFARDRFHQAREVARENRSDAKQLIVDGRDYLAQARRALPFLSADEQGQVESEINQAGDDQRSAEGQLNKQGGDQSGG
jgi:hypothetical protein